MKVEQCYQIELHSNNCGKITGLYKLYYLQNFCKLFFCIFFLNT